jgi:hypothetical protein
VQTDPLSVQAFTDAYQYQQDQGSADKQLHVEFSHDEVEDPILSTGGEVAPNDPRIALARKLEIEVAPVDKEKGTVKIQGAGRPIFKQVEMCEIRYGDKDNVVRDRVKSMHPDPRERFPGQYARFKAGEKTQIVGTLLREWGLIDRSMSKSYEAVGIFTVEQLAGLSDVNAQELRGSLADRQKAKDFLEMAKGHAPVAQARADLDRAQNEIRALRDELDAMKAAGEEPGRKPKK